MNTLKLRDYTGKALSECTILELYNAALALTQDACRNKRKEESLLYFGRIPDR